MATHRKGLRLASALPLVLGIVSVGGAACGAHDDVANNSAAAKPVQDSGTGDVEDVDGGDAAGGTCPGASTSQLDTFIGASTIVEIDQTGSSPGPNADLFTGGDPADGQPATSIQKPVVSGATYIDWNDLGSSLSNHRILDVYAGNGEKDPSSFAGSNSCVSAANNPSKDEILYAAVANSNVSVETAIWRASNLGDMGYTWLWTVDRPDCGTNGSCSSWLRFHITPQSVLFFGHFRTSGTKLLSVYKGNGTFDLDATAAIDWTPSNGHWTEDLSAVQAVAVNEDVTAAGVFGNVGMKNPLTIATDGGTIDAIEDHTFAEASVAASTFLSQPGESLCGKTFWLTVISNSTGNTPAGGDVKDLVGPVKVNFGAIQPTASASGNCDGTADLSASATDGENPLTVSCVWYEVNGGTKTQIASTCNPTGVNLGAGTHTLSVDITDSGSSGCSGTVDNISVEVFTPIQVSISPSSQTSSCSSTPALSTDAVTLNATISGGKPPYSLTWTGREQDASDGKKCTVDPDDSTLCTTIPIGLTVQDSTEKCPAVGPVQRTYTKQTTVSIETPDAGADGGTDGGDDGGVSDSASD